jgi:hypothetical protein
MVISDHLTNKQFSVKVMMILALSSVALLISLPFTIPPNWGIRENSPNHQPLQPDHPDKPQKTEQRSAPHFHLLSRTME